VLDFLPLLFGGLVLALPGMIGVALVAWRRHRGDDRWPVLLAWALPTAMVLGYLLATWRYAVASAENSTDDGSISMAAAFLLAGVVGNLFAGFALIIVARRVRR
jgi:uncharacterized sodium:solute symporter family permease YidK